MSINNSQSTISNYKLLAAKRLAIDPAELLMYFTIDDTVLVTTPDGKQHIFTIAELTRPVRADAKPVRADDKPVGAHGMRPPDRPVRADGVRPPVVKNKRGGAIS